MYASHNDPLLPLDRACIARVVSVVTALRGAYVVISEGVLAFAYEASEQYELRDLQSQATQQSVVDAALKRLEELE